MVRTLGKRHKLVATQDLNLQAAPYTEYYPILGRLHSDVRQIGERERKLANAEDAVYKQHWPPTPHNIALLAETKLVYLRRQLPHLIEAYRRAIKQGLASAAYAKYLDQPDFLAELARFDADWRQVARLHPEKVLVICYRDFITSPAETIRKVEAHLGLPSLNKPVVLARERYTGLSGVPHLLYRFRRFTRSVFTGFFRTLGIFEPSRRLYYKLRRRLSV